MFATSSKNEFLLFIPLAVGLPLFLWLTWRKPVLAHVDPIVSLGVFLLMVSIVGSYLFNSDFYELLPIGGNLGASILIFISLYVIVMKMEVDYRKLLVFQAVYIEVLMPAVLRSSNNIWGRLEPTCMTMNYASMMGIVAFFGALAARHIFVKGALSVLPLYTMVMMQSRGAMMATIFGTLIIIGCWFHENWSRKMFQRLSVAFVFVGIACVGAALAGYSIFDFIGNTVTKLFMLDDDQRGIGSGASGRSDLWAAAYNLWITHPIFGVGFKGHTQFMPDNMLAHNAFLGLLADNGLVGLAGYLMIILASVVCLFRRGAPGN